MYPLLVFSELVINGELLNTRLTSRPIGMTYLVVASLHNILYYTNKYILEKKQI